ncbi:sigma-70 family RNA polymerase sigma factor [Roseateles puraquae]|jgi:RNA polymerase sigma-70 factor (ECF subfamily)|uniref:RNA polymerase subunit sigma n=1 Tax=Roseateles puraquae TaxID=431059 RepID=A0A254N3Y4_9BURK|nr:sigma-70 family RNA polymerase sigma factor [Roseateles puraquae]MDG0854411.1 sigma-70 family RNA polymerase sigma factor [Roseateles puraquae]OWR00810.1 RNA polymerase subunit sigma [Roseateles puraquae]RTL38322.1 MAG: sigma-70 family RNA polymerase sigma factor [Burkholderiales bacterium]
MSDPRDSVEQRLRPLWLAAQAGDEAAYRKSLELMSQRLRAYFRRRMSDAPHDLEDLVQETLLAVHLQRGTFDAAVPVTAWLHAIARHKLVDLWRRTGRKGAVTDSFDDLDEAAHPVAPSAAPSRDLGVLLERLPLAMRRSIVNTKIEGLSVAEAARLEGVSESSVKVNVHRGLQRLAKLIRGTP